MKRKRIMTAMAALAMTIAAGAQTHGGYFVGKNYVSYCDSLMNRAAAVTFIDLGHGYAKDKSHVYKDGGILSFVDPATFAVKDGAVAAEKTKKDKAATADKRQEAVSSDSDDGNTLLDHILGTDEPGNRYAIDGQTVTYNGNTVKGADAATFKYVGGDYAADKHHGYYKGRILKDAWGTGYLRYKGNGTAYDGVHYYSNGLPVDRD